jgi:crotonobetainyl-CoA:carnitine CoA-transferase CaiB-like acyl-CoA transferase
VYRTKDDKWVSMSASTQAMTERLFRVIGRAELLDNPRYKTNAERVKHAHELDAIVGDFIVNMTQAENMAFFDKHEVTVGPVYDIAQFITDPHVLAREMVVEYPDDEMGAIPMHNVVPKMSGTPGAIRAPAPKLGEHNGEILGGLGLSGAEIQSLIDADVLYAGPQRKK